MFHQTLTVPSKGFSISVTDIHDNPISSGTDIGYTGSDQLWSWTGTQFTVQLIVTSTSNSVEALNLNTTQVPSGWVVSITGNSTLGIGSSETVTITATPPNANAGTTSGDFDLWFY